MNTALALLLSTALMFTAATKPTAMETVRAYAVAKQHKLTVRHDSGYVWVEMEGSDIFGVGRTEEDAAEDFLGCADLLTHEPPNPAHPAPFVCPEKDYCI